MDVHSHEGSQKAMTGAAKHGRVGVSVTCAPLVVEEAAPSFDGAEYTRTKSGTYAVQCVHAKIYRDPGFRTWKCMLRFRFVDTGKEVYGFFNLGRGKESHAGRRSRYWRAWTLANEAPPSKRQRMSPRVFRGKVFLVEVAEVVQTGEGKKHHTSAIYSTVKEIIEKAG